jgi:hypothetical protein
MDYVKIRTAMNHSASQGQEPKWGEVLGELLRMSESSETPEAKQLLLDILDFDEKLQLDESAEMPHSKPPIEMLKFVTQQLLDRWNSVKEINDRSEIAYKYIYFRDNGR